jgi:hypothetical protein
MHRYIMTPLGRQKGAGFPAARWEEIAGQEHVLPADKPLTLAAYESALTVRAYVKHVAVGEDLPDVSLFLEPGGQVPLPTEATCRAAFSAVPRRWQHVLEAART